MYIVQIYLCIRDNRIQNIYFVLFYISEAVDWCVTYQNCMLKTKDFLNKILLTREMQKVFTKGKKHSHRLKLIGGRGENEVSFSLWTTTYTVADGPVLQHHRTNRQSSLP